MNGACSRKVEAGNGWPHLIHLPGILQGGENILGGIKVNYKGFVLEIPDPAHDFSGIFYNSKVNGELVIFYNFIGENLA